MVDFRSVLIANRGEVAVRVARTLREMGLRSVGVFTPPDRRAVHLDSCDDTVEIDSYLNSASILAAARRTSTQAIHPGWGFLSQSPEFAESCGQMVFVGPTPASMRLMGNKDESRRAAERAGVPVVPGTGAMDRPEEIVAAVRHLGFPVMLKAVAGGGGKGMRRVEGPDGLDGAIESARREAESSFGDGRLLVERALSPVRHVEIQVIADVHGGVYALGERECSLQRRFQKIVEEAPSPAVSPEIRAQLQEAACRLARASGYTNAGTVEFLLRPDGSFCFLEMNTRLQVEHPVTECVTGVDLVRLQIEVAQGRKLSLPELPPRGHAIEARLYAENPEAGFLPTSGRVLALEWPTGVRIDHALRPGADITPDFDPMLGKIIAWAPDREQARRRLAQALRETVFLGVRTNLTWLAGLLETPEFVRGEFVTDRLPEVPAEEPTMFVWAAATAAKSASRGRTGAWDSLGRWRVGE